MARKHQAGSCWNACKKVLADRSAAGMVSLLGELYRLSDTNRLFLENRLLPRSDEAALGTIARQFRREFSYRAVTSFATAALTLSRSGRRDGSGSDLSAR